MHDATPTNKEVSKCILSFGPELLRRYGAAKDANRPQFLRTVQEMQMPQEAVPYLAAVFLSDDELDAYQADSPSVNWEEVRNRAARLQIDLQRARWNGDGFHESGIGMVGGI